jgi:hypothetical protein
MAPANAAPYPWLPRGFGQKTEKPLLAIDCESTEKADVC